MPGIVLLLGTELQHGGKAWRALSHRVRLAWLERLCGRHGERPPAILKHLQSQRAATNEEAVSDSYRAQSKKNQDQRHFDPTFQEKTPIWPGSALL